MFFSLENLNKAAQVVGNILAPLPEDEDEEYNSNNINKGKRENVEAAPFSSNIEFPLNKELVDLQKVISPENSVKSVGISDDEGELSGFLEYDKYNHSSPDVSDLMVNFVACNSLLISSEVSG